MDRAVRTRLTFEPDRNMRDAERGRGGNQIDEGELVHEVVKELAIVHQVRLGDIQRPGGRLRRGRLRFCFDAGGEQAREYIATIHARHCSTWLTRASACALIRHGAGLALGAPLLLRASRSRRSAFSSHL